MSLTNRELWRQRRHEPLPAGWTIERHSSIRDRFVCKNKALRIRATPYEFTSAFDHHEAVKCANQVRKFTDQIDRQLAQEGVVVMSHDYPRIIYSKDLGRMVVLGRMKTTGTWRRADLCSSQTDRRAPGEEAAISQALDMKIVDGFFREAYHRGDPYASWRQIEGP